MAAKKAKSKAKPAKKKAAKKPAKKAAAKAAKTNAVAKKTAVPRMEAPPVLWKLVTSTEAVGIYVDADSAYVANEAGEIFRCDHNGNVKQSYKLPASVKCIAEDEHWRYAGCDDGNVYDLGGKVPRAIFNVGSDVQINWVEVFRGNLLVCDNDGGVTVIGPDEELVWKSSDSKYRYAWMLRADPSGLYHGGNAGIRKLDWKKGKVLWKAKTNECHFGWDCGQTVMTITDDLGSTKPELVVVEKGSGKVKLRMLTRSEADAYSPDGAQCCAAGNGRYYGASGGFIFCFDSKGELVFETPTGADSACSMHWFDDRLYYVTSDGSFTCIDVSAQAVQDALEGTLPKARSIKAPKVKAIDVIKLDVVGADAPGVVLECVKEGSKLRVRVLSNGFDGGWFVQFPRDIREEGARYVVDELVEATQGGFYRVKGEIRRLQ